MRRNLLSITKQQCNPIVPPVRSYQSHTPRLTVSTDKCSSHFHWHLYFFLKVKSSWLHIWGYVWMTSLRLHSWRYVWMMSLLLHSWRYAWMTCGLLSTPVSCRVKVASILSSPPALWYQQEERPLWPGYRSSTEERNGNMGKGSGS